MREKNREKVETIAGRKTRERCRGRKEEESERGCH
jgi:hypothetical protein